MRILIHRTLDATTKVINFYNVMLVLVEINFENDLNKS